MATTLAAAQTASAVTATLAAALSSSTAEFLIQIGTEYQLVEKRGNTTTPQVRRGMFGTTATAHDSGVAVTLVRPQVFSGTVPAPVDTPDAGAGAFPDSWTVSEDGLQVNGTIGAFDETPIVSTQVSSVGGGESAAVVSVVSTRGGTASVAVIGSGADGESISLFGDGSVQMFTKTGVKGIAAWNPDGSVLRFALLPAGQIMTGVVAAPSDGDLSASQVALWFDDTNGAAKLKIKGKSANGTVVTGTVNLA